MSRGAVARSLDCARRVCSDAAMLESAAIDLEALVAAVREAGRLARDRQLGAVAARKPDLTWVTDADVAVEEYLVSALAAVVPGSSVLGEEGGLRVRGRDGGPVWVVDPIDGTADFLRGLPGWSVSAALFDGPRPVVGAVSMPITGDLYLYDRGRATWQGAAVSPIADAELHEDSLLLVPAGAPHRYRIEHPGKTQCVGSSSAHLLYVARGAAAAAVADPLYAWDLGVAVPFLRATGCDVCYISGAPVDLARLLDGRVTPEPVVAAPTQLLESARRMIVERTP
jgi:fructose-1,6-bisphosphatase/inositol monophosphatase family enzyme